MNNSLLRHPKFILICGFVICIAILLACGSQSTSLPQIPCPTIENLSESATISPKLIVVLIKEIPNYQQFSYEALDILRETLPQVMEPGDRLIVLSMEQFTISDARILDIAIDNVEKPLTVDLLTPPQPIGPLPSPTTQPSGNLMQSIATQDAVKYIQQTAVAATQYAFNYDCVKQTLAVEENEQQANWRKRKEAAIKKFLNKVDEKINENKITGFTESRNIPYKALDLASDVLDSECSKYKRCSLLIFSDMDFPYPRPDVDEDGKSIEIYLAHIDVGLMLLDCDYKSQCQDTLDTWNENFAYYGANAGYKIALRNDVRTILLDFLRR